MYTHDAQGTAQSALTPRHLAVSFVGTYIICPLGYQVGELLT